MPRTQKDITRITIELPEKLKEQFQEKLNSEGRTMAWTITKWIREYLHDTPAQ